MVSELKWNKTLSRRELIHVKTWRKDELLIRAVLMWSINPVQLAPPRRQTTWNNLSVLKALFFLLLTKQLISQYFFN